MALAWASDIYKNIPNDRAIEAKEQAIKLMSKDIEV